MNQKWRPWLVMSMGTVASTLLGLVASVILARLCGPKEWGAVATVTAGAGLVQSLLATPFVSAQNRFYFEQKDAVQREAYRGGVDRLLAWVILLETVGFCCVYWVMGWWKNAGLRGLFPAANLLILTQLLYSSRQSYAEADRRVGTLNTSQVCSRLAYLILALLLIYMALPGSKAVVVAAGLAPIIGVFIVDKSGPRSEVQVRMPVFRAPAFPRATIRAMVRFASGGVVATVAMWFVTSSDRIWLERSHGMAEAGKYAFNYGLWSLPLGVWNTVLETLMRPALYSAAASGEWGRVRQFVGRRVMLAAAGGVAILGVAMSGGPWVVRRVVGAEFVVGRLTMAAIAGAHVLQLIGFALLSGLLAQRRAWTNAGVTAFAALCCTVLNCILIPRRGGVGAAIATFATYGIWCSALVIVWIRVRRGGEPAGAAAFNGGARKAVYENLHFVAVRLKALW